MDRIKDHTFDSTTVLCIEVTVIQGMSAEGVLVDDYWVPILQVIFDDQSQRQVGLGYSVQVSQVQVRENVKAR